MGFLAELNKACVSVSLSALRKYEDTHLPLITKWIQPWTTVYSVLY